jgi:cytochrome c553
MLQSRSVVGFVMSVIAASFVFAAAVSKAWAESQVERGAYLASIMDCHGCHSYGALAGAPDETRHLAGSDIGFHLPGLGIFYPPNLTSDLATGLGNWSDEDILRAIRSGQRPDGRELAPIMPWRSYAALTDADAQALIAYLKTLPPYSFQAPGPFGEGEKATHPYLTAVMPE